MRVVDDKFFSISPGCGFSLGLIADQWMRNIDKERSRYPRATKVCVLHDNVIVGSPKGVTADDRAHAGLPIAMAFLAIHGQTTSVAERSVIANDFA